MKLLVIAHITAQPQQIDALKTASEALMAATRKEEGCLSYSLYQSTSQPEQFIMYEQWESAAHLEQHQQTTHLQDFKEKAPAFLAGALDVEVLPYPTQE